MTDKPKSEPIKTYMVLLTEDELWAVRLAAAIWKEEFFEKGNPPSEPNDLYRYDLYCDVNSGLRKLATNWVLTNEFYSEEAKLQE